MLKKLEQKGKRVLQKILCFLIGTKKTSAKIGKVRNVIIVRIDERLGNLVLITPVIKSFLKNNIKVTVIAAGIFSPILYTIKNIEIIEFNKKKLFNPFYLIRYILFLRKKSYDLLFDASNPNQMSTLTYFVILLLKAKYKIGFDRKNSNTILNILIPLPKKRLHILKYYKILFDKLGLKFFEEVQISLSKKARVKYKKLRTKKMIAIHPGGRGNKRWPVNRLIELLELIRNDYPVYEFIILLGPGEKDLINMFRAHNYRVVLPKDVMELASYLSVSDIFIGNDSGPMHLGSALGLKILAIFKESARIMFSPTTPVYEIVTAQDINSIAVKMVYEKFKKLHKLKSYLTNI